MALLRLIAFHALPQPVHYSLFTRIRVWLESDQCAREIDSHFVPVQEVSADDAALQPLGEQYRRLRVVEGWIMSRVASLTE
jgi:hypothetical protein